VGLLAECLADYERVLGETHKATITCRERLEHWRGSAL
jgi:hypothetical protein